MVTTKFLLVAMGLILGVMSEYRIAHVEIEDGVEKLTPGSPCKTQAMVDEHNEQWRQGFFRGRTAFAPCSRNLDCLPMPMTSEEKALGGRLHTCMETEPLLLSQQNHFYPQALQNNINNKKDTSSQMTNYRTEDGTASSILMIPGIGQQSASDPDDLLTISAQQHLPLDGKVTDNGTAGSQEKSSTHNILERFHEDALQQIGHGKMQITALLVCGLVMIADLSELMALIMSSKSAQFEFCVEGTQKSWIVGAALMGWGAGAIFWGSLGDRVGRRRALTYCLGVSVIFSGASVIMPTEGTFLTARIFSGMGIGGCLPLAVTYLSEFIQERRRRLATSILFLIWPLGAAYVIMLAWLILPSNGLELSEELKRHFSAWRRLLLASTIPSIISIFLLIFMPECPLNLMQNGRDAESLNIYKELYAWNRGTNSNICISELEIPTMCVGTPSNSPPPSSVIGDLTKAVKSFWDSFMALWSPKRKRLSITLTLIWFMAAIGQGALTSWVISLQATFRDWNFDEGATFLSDHVYVDKNITDDLVNIRYLRTTFINISFQNMMMNHVKFENCSFQEVNFTNVRTSQVLFQFSNLSECYIVDTDLDRSNFQRCVLENISYAGSDPSCHMIPDFNMELSSDLFDSGLPVLGIFLGALLSAVLSTLVSRSRLIYTYLILAAVISIGFTIFFYDTSSVLSIQTLAIIGHMVINFVLAGMWSVLLTASDKYPTSSRSGGLGFLCGAGRLGSFLGVGLFGTTLQRSLVPIFSSIFLVLSACIAFRTKL